MQLAKSFKMEKHNHNNRGYVYCSWCLASGLPQEKCRISRDEIGGVDKFLKQTVCKNCIDAALKIELMLSGNKQQELAL